MMPSARPQLHVGWLAYGVEAWLRDVEPILPHLVGYNVWQDEFVRLGEAAERPLVGARAH